MNGEFPEIDYLTIIDCRFPFEYVHGHIKDGINYYSWKVVQKKFVHKPLRLVNSVFIFHCEFSQHRSVGLGNALRDWDRKVNNYPNLYYPEVYILSGGYKRFFEEFPDLCDPSRYLTMFDSSYSEQMTRHLQEFNATCPKSSQNR